MGEKMKTEENEGRPSSSPPNRYQRVFLQSCLLMIFIFFICYTCVQIEYSRSTSMESYEWNLTNIVHGAMNRIRNAIPYATNERKSKLILLWTKYFSESDWLPNTNELQCPIKECVVTSDRSFLSRSSAVILHWRNVDPNDLPVCKYPNGAQTGKCPLLVLFNKEAPPHTPRERILPLKGKIHWTATYRRDSDLYASYGTILKKQKKYNFTGMERSRNPVCWLVSNCNTPSRREVYVQELKKYINVAVYGKCGTNKCPKTTSKECYRWLSKRCKFYLSFENSICTDYVTEKLFYALMNDMVPVVRGGANYSEYLPPHSFINANEFSSPKRLAEWLAYLDRDEEQYLSYFKWKENYEAKDASYTWLCDLCEKLHVSSTESIKPYKNFISWWFDKSNCVSL
ncbi:alpha-(1,3)-fucosyltransferase C-like isoform X2 [Stegodyphus dumicola]|uniref:alpha-(1,3)-fucosyltransferase C-like isoform X2 n=1 Tax=Stegodyphus dumicola TaxID=202533 RepID=UPI0015AEAD51|nr:alpha-(1,3)-fucosyltransferase C-like isoform X2 [Stegodyphus dumicola]